MEGAYDYRHRPFSGVCADHATGGDEPDFKHYSILWMGRKALGKSYEMDGAFNDVVLTLYPEANVSDVLAGIDHIVERYGGFGAYARKDQISHRLLNEEFRQLQRSSEIFPTIFICVAAFFVECGHEPDDQYAARADRRPEGLRLQ